MSPIRNQLTAVIDCLSEPEQTLLLEIAKRFVPDDVATPEDLEDIRMADEEFAKGEAVRHEDIDWN